MCGIYGIFRRGGALTESEADLVARTRLMAHRGPDDEGYYRGRNVFLGHRRLSIIDLSGGKQPIFNEDGTKCIVFNGEIYNYRSLRSELVAAGHVFRTQSDTEVILHAYEAYGVRCVTRFRGIFAFAIHDAARNVVYLGRDHVGVKPLYYHADDRSVVFSSEIKPILAGMASPPKLNVEMVDFFLSLGYTPHPHTFFHGIRKIPPGSYAIVGEKDIVVEPYWSIETIPARAAPPFPVSVQSLRELLKETIDLQLVSEVPVGVFLSGGLDSSTVVALMREIRPGEIKTFSVGYSDFKDVSELEYARLVSKAFGTKHFEYDLKFGDFFHSIRTLLEFSEEPVVESAAIALYHLSVAAKKEATVLLSGEGADELFAGYPMHRRMRAIERLSRIARFCPKILMGLIGKGPLTEKQRKYLDWIQVPLRRRYKTVSSDVTSSIRREMYTSDFRETCDDSLEAFFGDVSDGRAGETDLSYLLRLDTRYWLPDDLLLKADKMTMAASIELRVPFLDPAVIEFACRLPDQYKIAGGEGKHILKKSMEGLLPREIIYRTKRGFPLPIRKWFQKELFDPTRDVLLSRKFLERGFIRRDYVERILERHRSGAEDHSRRIFSFLTLEMWIQRYLEQPAASIAASPVNG